MCCNLSPELCAHVFSLWIDADTSKIESVGIPASPNRRLITQTAMCVPRASVVQKLKMLISDVEQHTTKARCVSCSQ